MTGSFTNSMQRRWEVSPGSMLPAMALVAGSLVSLASVADVETDTGRRACPVAKVVEICAPATPGHMTVDIDCDIDFAVLDCVGATGEPNVVTRRLRFIGAAASGRIADFDGAHLDAGPGSPNHRQGDIVEIRSRRTTAGRWQRPEHVTLRNARITGAIRVSGMGRNAEARDVRDSSRRAGHVRRVRDAAPTGIVLEHLDIVGTGRNPVYFAPGVTRSTLRDSTLRGVSDRVAIYLDAESGEIAIERNTIGVETPDGSIAGFYDRGWPQIAIDGSGGNRIVGNHFDRLTQGGIFLYRNCGEGGTLRHATPSGNRIADNVFTLRDAASDPVIHLGSRGYGRLENLMPGSHCNDDEGSGLRVGSALDNGDFASGNTVIGNRVELPRPPQAAAARKTVLDRLIRRGAPALGNRVSDNALHRLPPSR